MAEGKEVAKSEKKGWINLRTSSDCEQWFEKVANEVTQDQHLSLIHI